MLSVGFVQSNIVITTGGKGASSSVLAICLCQHFVKEEGCDV